MDRRGFIGGTSAMLGSWPFIAPAQGLRRAALVVGVGNASGLVTLRSTVPGAHKFAQFLEHENFEVRLHTDETQPVEIGALKRDIRELVDRNNIGQLVVYFSGHGIRMAYRGELWLLSHALDDPDEAINLVKCTEICRYCRIPNVIYISDACRSTAASLRMENVDGSNIFPSRDGNKRVAIDKFFAALPGNPSLEVEFEKSTEDYRSLYTEAFLNAFVNPPNTMTRLLDDGREVIPNRKLHPYLVEESKRLARKANILRNVEPDSEVPSADSVYIGSARRTGIGTSIPVIPTDPTSQTATTVDAYATKLGRDGVQTQPDKSVPLNSESLNTKESEIQAQLQEDWLQPESAINLDGAHAGIVTYGKPFKSIITHPDIKSEHVVQGASDRIASAAAIKKMPLSGASALVVFEDDTSAVVPLFQRYVTHVFHGESGIEGVSLEPVPDEQYMDEQMQSRLRALRALVTQATADGAFLFDGTQDERGSNAAGFADQIRMVKAYDPVLGVLAAYAYAYAYLPRQLESVREIMREDLDIPVFDIELLSRKSRDDDAQAVLLEERAAPFCPMMRSGWELLAIKGVELPEPVTRARSALGDSLWTCFGPEGTEILTAALQEGTLI